MQSGGVVYCVIPKKGLCAYDANTGETLWEHRYEAAYEWLRQYGAGPRSTPLLSGDRLFTVGIRGRLHALDKRDGRVLWSHDLWGETFGGNVLGHGYASSPVAYGDTVIVMAGRYRKVEAPSAD